MNKSLSIYLDGLRWLAALGVLLYHADHLMAPVLPTVLTVHGMECVAVFFVLSGFVIRYVSLEKEKGVVDYAGARLVRMYSVVFLAALVTLAADYVGTHTAPSMYAGTTWYYPSPSPARVTAFLTFTGELWFHHAIVGSNEPFWSLGFEVPYYVMFGLLTYAPGRWRVPLLLLWAAVVGPKILLYLPLWLLGVVTYDVIARRRIALRHEKLAGAALMALSLGLYAVVRTKLHFPDLVAMYKWGPLPDVALSFGYFMLVGLAVAINIIGFDLFARTGFTWPPALAKSVRWLAGASFTLYLVHEPLVACVRTLMPAALTSGKAALVATGLVFALTLLLAELGERRKSLYKRALKKVLWYTPAMRWLARAQGTTTGG